MKNKINDVDTSIFPSSKICSVCGWINNNQTLKDRTWTCEKCEVVHDRDVNATINILNEGCRKDISGGTSDYKRRAKIRLSSESISNEALKEKEFV